MYYNFEKESFSYYSDFNIPYRYLETIARKYIITFNCAILYIYSDEEMDKLLILRDEKEKEELVSTEIIKIEHNSSVFAKFKHYNKNNSISNTISQPTKQINNQSINMKKMLIKEKSNRYTYEGKLGNYSFLKKVLLKNINQNLKLSYSEFKNKLHNQI